MPAFRSDEALVVALDLSRSMDAGDVEPSRLARAKLKLLDLLERRAAGQTALVVFSTHAFTVTPLTTDTRTISALVTSVDTNIMPTQGGSIAAGLEKAATLLEQTGLSRGDLLLITDSEVADADLDLAGELAGDGYRVSVLAVGTEQGAPIPRAEGGFVTDANGQVVIPQLDASSLQRLAAAGGGRYAVLAPNDRDLDTLFPAVAAARRRARRICRCRRAIPSRRVARSRAPARRRVVAVVGAVVPARLDLRVAARRIGAAAARAGVRMAGSLAASRSTRLRRARGAASSSAPRSYSRTPEWRSAAQYRAGAVRGERGVARERRLGGRATTTAATRSRKRGNCPRPSPPTIARSSSTRATRTRATTATSSRSS